MGKGVIIVGAGDFALEVTEYIVEHYSDNRENVVSDIISSSHNRFDEISSIIGYKPDYHTSHKTIQNKENKEVLICIGTPESRDSIYNELKQSNFVFHTFVHRTALVSRSARIGEGSIICPNVFVGACSEIQVNTVINVNSTIGHDVKIGKSVVISPHVNCNGKSKCGDISFIGAGVVMNPSCSIGAYSKVSSGSLIKDNFDEGFLVVGNPATGRQMFHVNESKT